MTPNYENNANVFLFARKFLIFVMCSNIFKRKIKHKLLFLFFFRKCLIKHFHTVHCTCIEYVIVTYPATIKGSIMYGRIMGDGRALIMQHNIFIGLPWYFLKPGETMYSN